MNAPADGPRVGIAGFFLEANRFAPVTTGAMFAHSLDLAGDDLAAAWRARPPRTLPDLVGFVAGMDEVGPWQPVPLRAAVAYPGGPAEHGWFADFLDDLERRLRAALPLQAVFVSSHGAALTTADDEPDAALFERVRRVVGPTVPVVAVFDLHTNVSPRLTDALSGFVAYRTNPHVDLADRGRQAAGMLRRMVDQGPGEVALVKLPFLPASTDQLIAPGTPYAELIDEGQRHVGGDILDVSLCGGFPLADSPHCGFSVVVTARHGAGEAAHALARRMAAEVWARRERFLTALTSLADAVALAVQAGRDARLPPLILADVADNPGGGGGGNTVALLQALLEAGAQDVLLGLFCDPALAAEAHRRGTGARFEALFNRGADDDDPVAPPLTVPATVLALADGRFVGRQGLVKGTVQEMGPSARLELGGVQVVVITRRQQLLDPAQLDAMGIDLGTVRTLVVKSRGHFRAAFEGFAPAGRIIEVDGPGLTTPQLQRLPLERVPRPIYPLDPDTTWT